MGGAQGNRPLNQMMTTRMKFYNTSVKMTKIPKKPKKNQTIHQLMTFKKTPDFPKILLCKKNPLIHVVKNTTYVPIPTQTTLLHIDIKNNFHLLTFTDTKKTIIAEEILFSIFSTRRIRAFPTFFVSASSTNKYISDRNLQQSKN